MYGRQKLNHPSDGNEEAKMIIVVNNLNREFKTEDYTQLVLRHLVAMFTIK